MSFKTELFYAAVCDFPDCGAVFEGGEYTFWNDPQYALDSAIDSDWTEEEEPKEPGAERRLFCDAHFGLIRWRADDEDATEDTADERLITLPDGEEVVLRA